jgi:hypothetical protein
MALGDISNALRWSMFQAKMIVAVCATFLTFVLGIGSVTHALAGDATIAVQPSTAPATQPTTAPGPAAVPKDTVKNAIADLQAGDAKGFLSCFDHLTDEQTKTLKTIVRVLAVASDLRKAVVDKFGKDAGDQVIASFGGNALQSNALDNLPVTITGDKADVGEGAGAFHLVKIDGAWKMITDGDRIAQAGPFFDNIDGQLDSVKTMIADVKAGKYANADDLKSAVKDLVTPKPDNGL